MNKNQNQKRQGDILIEKIEGTTAATQPKPKQDRVILAHGEVTGHAHEIEAPRKAKASINPAPKPLAIPGDMDVSGATQSILTLGRDAKLVHQEHATIALDAGEYRVTRQREYSPEAIRNVAD